jgi:hypothetical protein
LLPLFAAALLTNDAEPATAAIQLLLLSLVLLSRLPSCVCICLPA